MIVIFTICSEIPLSDKKSACFKGIAFDGCRYYLTTACDKEITVLNKAFQLIECVKTCRSYSALCYDTSEDCFWASSNQGGAVLFKLNRCFQEVDRLVLRADCGCAGLITGISFCCDNDRLLVCLTDRLLLVDRHGHGSEIVQKGCADLFIGAVCMQPYYAYIAISETKYILKIISRDGKSVKKEYLPREHTPQAALLYPCKDCHGRYHIYLLTCKHGCYAYLLDIELDECLSDLLYCCNSELCEKCCGSSCGCDKPHCHDCSCDCSFSCNDILESIALQEAALAHILNAEGEKLQKAIADDADICELLEVNESVRKTITHATHLEQVLFAKLEVLSKCCNFCDKPDCCPPCNTQCNPHCGCDGCDSCVDINPCGVDGGVIA